jgi:Fanconi-associated nuclease 1
VPDLVVWNAERSVCKFVEVKGPGDRPQENQKVRPYELLLYCSDSFRIALV